MLHPFYKSIEIPSKEKWKDVKGYEGYYRISSHGRIKSTNRLVLINSKTKAPFMRRLRSKLLSLTDSGGSLIVWLHKEGKSSLFSVHKLVLTAFIGQKPLNTEGCHWDGDYTNNRLENLRWDTHKNNHQDRIRHKTNNQGESNGSAVLTESKVRKIRKLYATGKYRMCDLGKKFNLKGKNSARGIIRGITWKHVI